MSDQDCTQMKSDVKALELWRAEHSGRNSVQWEQQMMWNARMETAHGHLLTRMSTVEKKVVWWAGFAACLGTLLGFLITKGIALLVH